MGTTYASQSLLTSARTTGQTVLDSDGNLKWALHNLVPNTDLSDTGDWTHTNLASVAESGASPSGRAAYLVTEDGGPGNHIVSDVIASLSPGVYTVVFDVKANGRTALQVEASAGAFGDPKWSFDLSGVTVSQDNAGNNDSASITLISEDWYRCVLTIENTSTASPTLNIGPSNGTGFNYTGDGASGLYLSRPRVYRSAIHSPSELVTNGTFDSDITGWTLSASTPPTWDAGGYMQLNSNGSTFSDADQSFTTVAGGVYVLSVELVANASSTSVYVGTSQGSSNLLSETFSTLGVHTYTFTATGTTTWLRFRDGSGAANQQIDNVSVYQVLDSGMQNGSDGTDYVETSGSAVYHAGVAYDGSGACLGMQSFEGRTNILLNSATLSTQSVTTTNVPHTLSFKGTGTITLTGTSTAGPLVGTGSGEGDRVELTFTPTAGSLTCTVSGAVEQAQLEAGSSPTPYIPTTSSAVARGADDITLAVADFGYNASEGTVLATGQTLKADEVNNTVWSLVGAGADYMNSGSRVGGTAGGTYTTWVQDDGDTEVLMNSTSVVTDGENFNAATAYKEDNFAQSGGGQTVVTDTSGTIPTVTTLKLGNGTYGHLNGYIKSLAYYPVRLADATLEAESA